MTDRIKLAEAVGLEWLDCIPGRTHIKGVFILKGREWKQFNPFTDANDDYAVLEWMRGQDWPRWALISEGCEYCFDYQIGDYARAALKVLDNQ